MNKVQVLADSITPTTRHGGGDRITTFLLTYPRIIHSQILTHRMFSRNSSSSRAVPVKRLIEQVKENPFIPQSWGKNQRGMVAGPNISDPVPSRWAWEDSLNQAIESAEKLAEHGVAKQWVNRLLEPFSYITTIITATEWENFYHLRCADDCQPELMELACEMRKTQQESIPEVIQPGYWHLPFIDPIERREGLEWKLVTSVARCARLSYLNFDGGKDHTKDRQLFDTLKKERHESPFEHQATPYHAEYGFNANFNSWLSLRKRVADWGWITDPETETDFSF